MAGEKNEQRRGGKVIKKGGQALKLPAGPSKPDRNLWLTRLEAEVLGAAAHNPHFLAIAGHVVDTACPGRTVDTGWPPHCGDSQVEAHRQPHPHRHPDLDGPGGNTPNPPPPPMSCLILAAQVQRTIHSGSSYSGVAGIAAER